MQIVKVKGKKWRECLGLVTLHNLIQISLRGEWFQDRPCSKRKHMLQVQSVFRTRTEDDTVINCIQKLIRQYVQLNVSSTATLGTEESGHCREVERRVNTWTASPPLPPKIISVSFLTLRAYFFFHFTKLLQYDLLQGPPYSSSRIEMCDFQARGIIRT